MDKHVELLREMVADFSPPDFKLERAALTAAIAALEAVGNADEAFVHDDNEIIHADAYNAKYYGRVLIIPADAVKEPTNDN